MRESEKTFQILDALDREEISTQRQLADHSGISLGQVNYILKSLLEEGLIKIGNFRKNSNKIGYVYLLTPKGVETKSRLAVRFVIRKLREYEYLRSRLAEKFEYLEKRGCSRLIFIGPTIINTFLNSLIKENNRELQLVGEYRTWDKLNEVDPNSFDAVIFFDEDQKNIRKIEKGLDVPREKLVPLW
jgi:EPS-associated MarR family transcriptional regulator